MISANGSLDRGLGGVGVVGVGGGSDLIHVNASPPLIERAAASKIHFLRRAVGGAWEARCEAAPHRLIRQRGGGDCTLVNSCAIVGIAPLSLRVGEGRGGM